MSATLGLELRRLVGYGLTRRKLSRLPGLMKLGSPAQVDRLIREAVSRFPSPEKEAFDLLLVLTRRGQVWKAPRHRLEAMKLLNFAFSLRDFIEEEEPRLFERLAEVIQELGQTAA